MEYLLWAAQKERHAHQHLIKKNWHGYCTLDRLSAPDIACNTWTQGGRRFKECNWGGGSPSNPAIVSTRPSPLSLYCFFAQLSQWEDYGPVSSGSDLFMFWSAKKHAVSKFSNALWEKLLLVIIIYDVIYPQKLVGITWLKACSVCLSSN